MSSFKHPITQTLLADKLDRCKGKGNSFINKYIKEIQDSYKIKHQNIEQTMTVGKGKQ